MDSQLPPPPTRSLRFACRGVEFVLRPGAALLLGGMAVVFGTILLPETVGGQSSIAYLSAAVAMALLVGTMIVLHESGHALAYRLQGIGPVRISLRASGGGCAAMVGDDDRPSRALVRALAGPVMTGLGLCVLFMLAGVFSPGSLARASVLLVFVFGIFDLVCNTLPLHPRCDGTFALTAALWLVRGAEPDRFAVLYIWRPLVIAAVMLCGPLVNVVVNGEIPIVLAMAVAGWSVLILCAVALGAVVRRLLEHARPLAAGLL